MTEKTFTNGSVIEIKGGGYVTKKKAEDPKLLGDARFFTSLALKKWQEKNPNIQYDVLPARQSSLGHVSLVKSIAEER